MKLWKLCLYSVAMLALSVGAAPSTNRAAPALAVPTEGVGAFGTIQPRSRVITLSHDGGPEGVRVDKILIKEGDEIKEGQIIAVFSDLIRRKAKLSAAQSRERVLQSNLSREQSNVTYLRQELDRLEQLQKTMAVTPSQLGGAKRNYQMSVHAVESLRSELTENALMIALAENEVEQGILRSPINGTVLEILVRPGERAVNDGIMKIADLSTFEVVAEVYERDIHKVRIGQKVQVTLQGANNSVTGTVNQIGYLVKKSQLFYQDAVADRDERVIEVRAKLDGAPPKNLKHLVNAEVRVRFK